MLAYVIDAARAATGEKPLVVYSTQAEAMTQVFADAADFALQHNPKGGTGDALRAALESLPADVDEVLVTYGDVPLIEPDSMSALLDGRRESGAPMALAAVELDEPAHYGRVVTAADGGVERIIEFKDASEDEREIAVINAGLYAFDAAWLRGAISKLTPSSATGELYLTQLVEIAVREGNAVVAVDEPEGADWQSELAGINDRSDLAEVQLMLQFAIVQRHMEDGVTFHDPASSIVDATVEIDEDVTIEPNVILRGDNEDRPRHRDPGRQPAVRLGDRRAIGRLVQRDRGLEGRERCQDRAVRPPARRLRDRRRRGARATSPSRRTCVSAPAASSITSATWATPRSARTSTSVPGRSPPTTTGAASTARPSATARSSAGTRSCARR